MALGAPWGATPCTCDMRNVGVAGNPGVVVRFCPELELGGRRGPVCLGDRAGTGEVTNDHSPVHSLMGARTLRGKAMWCQKSPKA